MRVATPSTLALILSPAGQCRVVRAPSGPTSSGVASRPASTSSSAPSSAWVQLSRGVPPPPLSWCLAAPFEVCAPPSGPVPRSGRPRQARRPGACLTSVPGTSWTRGPRREACPAAAAPRPHLRSGTSPLSGCRDPVPRSAGRPRRDPRPGAYPGSAGGAHRSRVAAAHDGDRVVVGGIRACPALAVPSARREHRRARLPCPGVVLEQAPTDTHAHAAARGLQAGRTAARHGRRPDPAGRPSGTSSPRSPCLAPPGRRMNRSCALPGRADNGAGSARSTSPTRSSPPPAPSPPSLAFLSARGGHRQILVGPPPRHLGSKGRGGARIRPTSPPPSPWNNFVPVGAHRAHGHLNPLQARLAVPPVQQPRDPKRRRTPLTRASPSALDGSPGAWTSSPAAAGPIFNRCAGRDRDRDRRGLPCTRPNRTNNSPSSRIARRCGGLGPAEDGRTHACPPKTAGTGARRRAPGTS